MTKIIGSIVCVLALAACGGKTIKGTGGSGEKISGDVHVQSVIPYANGAVSDKVKNECVELGQKLSDFTVSYGKKNGLNIKPKAKVSKTTKKGNVLVMKMTNVHSSGNPFMGHNKSVTVNAALYKNGVLVDSITQQRSSGGGIGGGFKSSCSVLGRTVKTLGNDVAKWVKTYTL